MKTMQKPMFKKLLALLFLAVAAGCLFILPCAAEDGAEEETLFSALYAAMQENAEAICSLLALLGSVIVTVLYKKGLHPLISRAVNAMRAEVGNLKSEAGEKLERTDQTLDALNGELALLSESVEALQAQLKQTEETIIRQDDTDDRAVFGKVLDEEVNLLYDIFMSTSLPQYQKESVGERTAKMKREIAAIRECDGDEA